MGSFRTILKNIPIPILRGNKEGTTGSEEGNTKAEVVYFQSSPSSDSEIGMGRHCLCDTVKPILVLAQMLGLVPLSLQHIRKGDQIVEESNDCILTCNWKCYGAIVNSLLIGFFVSILPFARDEIRDRMSVVFTGTDMYAFTYQSFAMVVETTALLAFGRLYKSKFAEGWKSLNSVFHDVCDSANDLRKIKIGCYVTVSFTTVEGFCIFGSLNYTSLRSIGAYESCPEVLFGTAVITLTLIIPYVVSTLFLFICLLIRSHFLRITELLKTIVRKRNSPKLSGKIDTMRVLHEQLCQTVAHFEDFFGVQVLLTLCTCCFTVTIGAYATILQGEGISSPLGKELITAWGTQLYSATIFLFLILISGQLVTNAVQNTD